jgi:bifunctional non-homologous end joining protein LigD
MQVLRIRVWDSEGVALDTYRGKRKFGETPEPAPAPVRAGRGDTFVVQQHDATRLHWDFRLEIDGVLASWAVPKGPSLNPADKRLAVETEDHPLEYASFEGVIPKGNYGAGPVQVWDCGTYEMEGGLAASEQRRRGELKFRLHGRKLRGSFALVHTGKRATEPKDRKNWLLIKHADASADPGWNIGALDWSALTGRTIQEIADGLPGHASTAADLPGARKARMPAEAEPALATLIDKPFTDPGWIFELKWDGMRVLARIRDGKAELRSRTGRIVTAQFPELAALPARIAAAEALLDGEVVVLDEEGRPDFSRLQRRMGVERPAAALVAEAPALYYVFDLLHADGYDLRATPLLERKDFLRRMLLPEDPLRYSSHVTGDGEALYKMAREKGLEGIVGKQARSVYPTGRSAQWVKLKTTSEVDAVVGGFTAPRGGREHFGALLVGLHDGARLRFVGGVGTGFDQKTQAEVARQLQPLIAEKMPFAERPATREKARWVAPKMVARVRFAGWTPERHLRAPVFVGLRPGVDPKEATFRAETPKAQPSLAAEIAAAPGDDLTLAVEGRKLRLTHLNKIFFPEIGLAKRDLLAYYASVAGLILPFLRDRPLVLRRLPDGVAGGLFYQKEAGKMPEWIRTVSIPSEGKKIRYVVCDDLATLLWLTHLGCIDHNPWASRIDDLERPDYVFIDLDPSEGTPFASVVDVAREVCAVLAEARMKVYVKTSGASGIHIFLPIERVYSFEQAAMFGQVVSRIAAARIPDKATFERTVSKRPRGSVLLDYAQLAYSRPLASVYSVRPEPQATVSAPITVQELRPALTPAQFTLKNMPERIEKAGDLWADFWTSRQRLEPALERLKAMGL